jgi:uncharacterized protein YbjT (DUF2867 family)
MRLAVLGGSGSLGQAVTAVAIAAGHTVTAVSRRPPAQLADGVRHVAADVTTGIGLDAAFAGAEAVIDGTNAQANAHEVLVDGTRTVLDAAEAARVPHFVGISIVGIDAAPLAYYKIKVEQEAVIRASRVPWSLLRATQFHDLIPRLTAPKLGIAIVPRRFPIQPIDVREVAQLLVDAAIGGPAGRLPDAGGPEVLQLADLGRAYFRAAHKRRLVMRVPVPGATGRFLAAGSLCCPEHKIGTKTFAQWLAETFPEPS